MAITTQHFPIFVESPVDELVEFYQVYSSMGGVLSKEYHDLIFVDEDYADSFTHIRSWKSSLVQVETMGRVSGVPITDDIKYKYCLLRAIPPEETYLDEHRPTPNSLMDQDLLAEILLIRAPHLVDSFSAFFEKNL